MTAVDPRAPDRPADPPVPADAAVAALDPALHPRLLDCFGVWRSIATAGAGDGPVPPKRGFDPVAMPPRLLPNIAIYERRAPDDFLIRLMGTSLVERIGIEGTGRNVLEFVAAPHVERMAAFFNTLLDRPCAGRSVVQDRFASGRVALVDILRLPLADADGIPRYIVACSAELRAEDYQDPTDRPVLISQPHRMAFIDIGFGAPAAGD
jgi:hypothetical protein